MIAKLAVFLLLVAALAAQPAPNRAGLVIQYADGSVETQCIRFSEPQLNGLELLERADVPLVTQGSPLGAAVCKIGPDGCDFPAESCFCATEGIRSVYWALHVREGDRWTYASLGAANMPVSDGTIHGWAWGTGDSSVGAQPPLIDLDTICGPVAEVASATPPTPSAAPTEALRLPEAPAPTLAPPITPEAPDASAQPAPAAGPTLWIAVVMLAGLTLALVAFRRRR